MSHIIHQGLRIEYEYDSGVRGCASHWTKEPPREPRLVLLTVFLVENKATGTRLDMMDLEQLCWDHENNLSRGHET